jgi:hypothetical protein
MKKAVISLIILISISINGLGQRIFEKGYFINNENKQTDCLIKNNDWLKNPTNFKYKLSDDGEVKDGNIEEMKEFGIGNSCKYIRAEVNIDQSASTLKDISLVKEPLWQKKQVYLKVLVEGKATLYYYTDGALERFFYSSNNSAIEQLVYKEYRYNNDYTAFNDSFRVQLNNHVNCSFETRYLAGDLAYEKKDLMKYFQKYNSSIGSPYKITTNTNPKGEFRFSLSTGLNYSSLSVSNGLITFAHANFDKKISNTYSAEFEFILPFNNNKWGIAFGPSYQTYHSSQKTNSAYMTVDFTSIDLAIGLKHYFFLNKNAKIYAECYFNSLGSYSFESQLGYRSNYSQNTSYLKIKDYNMNFLLGTGFEYKRWFAELRYYTNQNLNSRHPNWLLEYNKLSLNVGCHILRIKGNNH